MLDDAVREGSGRMGKEHKMLPDKRLQVRLERSVECLAAAPEASTPQACGIWAETKAVHRFWG
jgi:hypothetical protein